MQTVPYKDPEATREWFRKRRAEIRRVIDEAKTKPCTDCGVQYPLPAMQFDHVRGRKKFDIAKANGRTPTLEALLKELAKCDVVCANCHALRSYERAVGTAWACNREDGVPARAGLGC